MKKNALLCCSSLVISLFLGSTASLWAKRKAIYGHDDRVFIKDSYNRTYKRLASSVAAQISNDLLTLDKEGKFYFLEEAPFLFGDGQEDENMFGENFLTNLEEILRNAQERANREKKKIDFLCKKKEAEAKEEQNQGEGKEEQKEEANQGTQPNKEDREDSKDDKDDKDEEEEEEEIKEYSLLCEGEKFAHEINEQRINVSRCSGFLVGEDLLVTAGHCLYTEESCKNAKWAFNFEKKVLDKYGDRLPAEDVYSCAEIISQKDEYDNDFALIRLDRKVKGRMPLEFRTQGRVGLGDQLFIVGHPAGLPKIVADGAWVRDNMEESYFLASLDSFGGNSGSPVFNSKTGIVEGILVRGMRDFQYDRENECFASYRCEDHLCGGEGVTRITNIPELSLSEEFENFEDKESSQCKESINLYSCTP